MKILILSVLTFFLTVSSTFSQTSTPEDVRMFLDCARFRYDNNNTYVEIYYLLYDLRTDSSAQELDVWLQFSLSDADADTGLATSNLKVTLDAKNSPGYSNVKGNLFKIPLPIGKKYRFKMVRLSEDQTERIDSLSQVFSTSSFETDRIAVSDLELCSNIITGSANRKGPFYKNTMEVFPNPMHMYGEETPELFYYIEIYNLRDGNPRDEIKIEVQIVDAEGQIVEKKNYSRSRDYESLVEFGSFDVSGFKNGLYTLVFAVTDTTVADYSVYTQSKFYVMSMSQLAAEQESMMSAFTNSEFFTMSESEVEEHFGQISYIATEDEKRVYKGLTTVESKRQLLFKFWYEKERYNPGIKTEFYSRVEHANQYYGFSNRKGWQSDRGRVYIVYGEPSDRQRNPLNTSERPYVIWTYLELEGGVKFLFMDVSGFGDYRLMTSTMRGEIYDPSWDQFLIFTGQ